METVLKEAKSAASDDSAAPDTRGAESGQGTDVCGAEGRGARPKRQTEKGRLFSIETKKKRRNKTFSKVDSRTERMKKLLAEHVEYGAMKDEYSQWMASYEEFFNAHDEYCALLDDEERDNYYEEWFNERDQCLRSFKSTVEDWFSRRKKNVRLKQSSGHFREDDNQSIISGISSVRSRRSKASCSASLANSVSSARVLAEQKRAELLARVSMSKKRQALEQAKLQLKFDEEELELAAGIAIEEAKCAALNRLEIADNASVQQSMPALNPNAPQFASVMHRHLQKPASEIKRFDGNLMDYRKFMRQFNSKVVLNTDTDEERMNFLEQYTGEEANRIVSGFSHLDARQGYQAAMKELEERYGDVEVIANAFIRKALTWPTIKADDAKALGDFSIFLTECENAVLSIEAVKVLEYPDNMRKLLMKLPYYFHDKWRGIVLQTKENHGVVKFHQLVQLVKQEAKKANDPMYGKAALNEAHHRNYSNYSEACRSQKTSSSARSRASFATNITDVYTAKGSSFNSPCTYCGADQHVLESCQQLVMLPSRERIDFLRSKGLCFGCLKPGHQRRECRMIASCSHCNGRHPSVLHTSWTRPPVDKVAIRPNGKVKVERKDVVGAYVAANACNRRITGEGECTMAVIPVRVKMKNGLKSVDTYAFLDPGSSVTFCTEDLLREIGGSGRKMKITLDTMGVPHTMSTYTVKGIEVCDLQAEFEVCLPKTYTNVRMPVSKCHIPTQVDIAHWPHLKGINLPEIQGEIGLLIGNNVPDAYTPLEIRTGPSGSPHATKTRLGWVVWNVVRGVDVTAVSEHPNRFLVNRVEVIREMDEMKKLDHLVRSSINFDFPESITDDKKEDSQEDKRFREKVSSSIRLVDGHYEIRLPFRKDDEVLPNNRAQAMQRLKSLKKKLEKDMQFQSDYKDFMSSILEKGYAEKVPEGELHKNDGREWYIPHHGVYHPKKPGKIRVVFDCTATHQGVSLNSRLLQGPDLTNSLIGVLLRFRQEKVAVMADIEAMFYQVKVSTEDTNATNSVKAKSDYRGRLTHVIT
ncbi:PREDICTED: uncharacterized protein LOC106813111 [Priapulus caudatus]|uniref:Uncharacterized protein LOC106813111 n=1 Tax=Priapulus caudatus TaxID=37621 RepID=A0ABM1EKD2_PRICU|nr:PREDICTED: uncharacterized protein LOC106813111 [Priapulus caudatus]